MGWARAQGLGLPGGFGPAQGSGNGGFGPSQGTEGAGGVAGGLYFNPKYFSRGYFSTGYF